MTDIDNTCEHVKKKGRNKRGYCWPCLAAKMREAAVKAIREKALLKRELLDVKKELKMMKRTMERIARPPDPTTNSAMSGWAVSSLNALECLQALAKTKRKHLKKQWMEST